MYVQGWGWFWLSLLISALGFYLALSTSLGNRQGDEIGFAFRWYAKFGGWSMGIGGILLAIRLLLLFTGYTRH